MGGGIITHDLSLSTIYHFDITVSNFILVQNGIKGFHRSSSIWNQHHVFYFEIK